MDKLYKITFTTGEKPVITDVKKATSSLLIKMPSVRAAFAHMKTLNLPNLDIYWIRDMGKNREVFNKFCYLDKKTGEQTGLKLIYDHTKQKYINTNPSVAEHALKGDLGKAARTFYVTVIKRNAKILRQKFEQFLYSAQKELLLDKDLFYFAPIYAGILNKMCRHSNQTKLAREKANFKIIRHLWKQDVSGLTEGCGCLYCRLHYQAAKYRDESESAFARLMLFKAARIEGREKFYKPEWSDYLNSLPVAKCAERRYIREFSKLKNKQQQFSTLANKIMGELQIPKIRYHDEKARFNKV